MSWSKLSDDFGDDCWTLSDAAFRLHVEGLCWNGRKLLDCRIPKGDLRLFAKAPRAVDELLAVGWWSDDGDAYTIRHHATYQRTREAILKQQEVNSQNGKRGGRPRKPKPPTETDSLSDSLSAQKSDSKSERDRPGQARVTAKEVPNDPWAKPTEDTA